jgi:hypothetical protein
MGRFAKSIHSHNPELTLSKADRRHRAKAMARIKPGANDVTKRQIKRLPSDPRKQARGLRRIAQKIGRTVKEILYG